ncbi:unnamed protein product [Adineta steineri]|uniref:Uncharacterized protein n=1 Tax=Adineta steineri TaxID=433720 RepID=A0A815XBD6_9BILA|nr:unnamed protein product [Adineta steineri]CAF1555451.1 unnamed protein product [Adineta steineri]
MILHICQYLRNTDILYSLFNLNTRFNVLISGFCYNLDLNNTTHKQFNCVLSNILSQIGSNIQSFVLNGNWTSFLSYKKDPIHLHSNLSLMFPNLQVLTLEYFTGEHLCTFLEKMQSPLKLVKLNIKYLMDNSQSELLERVLSINNCRLRSITFDQNSIFLPLEIIDKTSLYPNIEELTVNLIDCEMLGNLFTLLVHIRRLHINLGVAPSVSTASLKNVPALIHLTDFQLYSIQMSWTFENIQDIMCKMPSLQRLALYLSTEDRRLVNKQDLATILPSSQIQMDFFIVYHFSEPSIEVDTSLDTWPRGQISMTRLSDGSNQYALIHTVPFNGKSLVIPSILGKSMLPAWKYMQKVRNLRIRGELSSIDMLMIMQHLHGIETFRVDLKMDLETPIETQSVVLHLPQLKKLKVAGSCELFRILEAAPNLNDLSITFDCYNRIINDESLCKLLEKRIVRLEIFRLEHNQKIQLDLIIKKFTNLRHMVLCISDSSADIDSLFLQGLEMWREEELIYLCLKGPLSQNRRSTVHQWFNDHSYLQIEAIIRDENLHIYIVGGRRPSCCLALNYVVCGLTVGSAVYKQYASWSDVDTKQAFGTTCNSQFKGGFHDWEWKWSGKFSCPSLSPTVMGESTQYASRTGAIEHAVQDYVTKMTSAGLLKPEQLNT